MINGGKQEQAYAKMMRTFQAHPETFCRQMLGWEPWEKQEEILRSVIENKETYVKSCNAAGKCRSLNSSIILNDSNVVEAGSLIGKAFYILGWDEETGKQVPALATAESNGVKAVYRIRTSSGRVMEATANHPLYSAELIKHRGLKPQVQGWTNVEDLRIETDAVLVPTKLDVSGGEEQPDHLVKFMGYMLGDGCTTKGVGFTQQYGKAWDDFIDQVFKLGCITRHARPYQIDVVGNPGESNHALEMIREWGLYGKKAKHKRLTEKMWKLPNEQLALLINRLFACDGWAYVRQPSKNMPDAARRPIIGITLASEGLVRDVQLALLRLGIDSNIRYKQVILDDEEFDSWELTVLKSNDIATFCDVVGIYGKEDKLEAVIEANDLRKDTRVPKWQDVDAPEGYKWDKVKSVEFIGEQETVAINVPEYEAYVTSFVEHNSWLAAGIVIWWMFTRRGKVVTTAPTWRQVREVLWANIGAQCEANIGKLGMKPLQSSMKLKSDWFAVGLSTRVPDKFQGYHGNVLIVVDEASGVNDPNIWAAIDGNLTDNKHDRLLAIGNPLDPTSVFASKFKLPQKKGLVKKITISAYDTPNLKQGKEVIRGMVTTEWVEQKLAEWGYDSPLFQARILGEFPKTGLAALFPLHWLERAFGYTTTGHYEAINDSGEWTQEWVHGLPDLSDGASTIALDVSGSGADNNAMTYMTGNKLQNIVGWPTVDSSNILGDDNEAHDQPTFFGWVRQYRPDFGVIDALGLGDPIYKYARKYKNANRAEFQKFKLKAFKASNAAVLDHKYENYKAEAYFKVRDLLGNTMLDWSNVPPAMRETLVTQANAIRWQTSKKRGLIEIESKDQMRRRVPEVGSPDELESVIMAIAGGKNVTTDKRANASFTFNASNNDAVDEMVNGNASFEYKFDRYART